MLINILAAASNAAPAASFGIGPAIKQGGAITIFILVVLALMSVGSFYILIVKWLEQNRIFRQYRNARTNFWRANTLAEGATKLDKNSAWRQLVDDALAAEAQHTKMTDSLEAHDWLHGSLARSEASINAKLAGGLPFLATTGATAPFVGLLVAVPAVFAYNWLQNRNKRISELLAAFSTDILANLTSRGAVKPAVMTQSSTQQAARTTAPASKA
jgi:biopolymer transport protein ExbB